MSKEKVDHSQIPQKSIRKFLKDEELKRTDDFTSLRSSRRHIDESFRHHFKSYTIKAPLAVVWKAYLNTGPETTWQGGLISYGFTFDPHDENFKYSGDTYPGLREGQIIFLNLKMLFGLVDITIAHKVIEIDATKRFLLISYLQKNKSAGSQKISFRQSGDETIIDHKTRFKSNSVLRDKLLYPFFHSRIIRRFHHNILEQLKT